VSGPVVPNMSVGVGNQLAHRGVGNQLALVIYPLREETGDLLVSTGLGPPGMGAEVRVKGSIESMAIIGGQSFGLHLKESQRW